MTRKHLLGSMLAVALLTACDYQKNNTIAQNDLRAGNATVYGVHPDSAARQTKNKYTAKPELEVRALKIKDKLFGAAVAASQESGTATPDSTAGK